MEFIEFRKIICEKMEERLGEGYQIGEHDTEKINGIVKQGISIRHEKENIGTICYLNQLYEDFMEGLVSEDEIIDLLCDTFEHEKYLGQIDKKIAWSQDWEKAKDYIKARLINTEKNEKLLKGRTHVNILDLSVIFHLEFFEEDVRAGFVVSDEMMAMWGQDKDTLLKQAIKNMEAEGIHIINIMAAKQKEVIHFENDKHMKDVVHEEPYVLTCKNVAYGAAAILSPQVRNLICKSFEDGVYILPSSIHELMLISKRMFKNVNELQRILKIGNMMTIEPEEYLSDMIYELDECGQLKFAE